MKEYRIDPEGEPIEELEEDFDDEEGFNAEEYDEYDDDEGFIDLYDYYVP